MGAHQPTVVPHTDRPTGRLGVRPLDSYGLVLFLIILDYIAMSAWSGSAWGKVFLVMLVGSTVVFTLRTSQAHRIWQLLAFAFLVINTIFALLSVTLPGVNESTQKAPAIGGLLLLVTPFAILRRIGKHKVVTTETVLGAICVYLLIGFSFAVIYMTISLLAPPPFFIDQSQPQATLNSYLFFSYTTLTTVGYGNLVPAGNVGQTFAMLEALMGQIYLVIIVARLVSLWGQQNPTAPSQSVGDIGTDVAHQDEIRSAPNDADKRDSVSP